MFERYTEHGRRTIFFARYEASQLGSPNIETGHVLLGLLREDHFLRNALKSAKGALFRAAIQERNSAEPERRGAPVLRELVERYITHCGDIVGQLLMRG
jgi:hypothetical protein